MFELLLHERNHTIIKDTCNLWSCNRTVLEHIIYTDLYFISQHVSMPLAVLFFVGSGPHPLWFRVTHTYSASLLHSWLLSRLHMLCKQYVQRQILPAQTSYFSSHTCSSSIFMVFDPNFWSCLCRIWQLPLFIVASASGEVSKKKYSIRRCQPHLSRWATPYCDSMCSSI